MDAMSLAGDYDPTNVFAAILAGTIPAARIYEDGDTLAFLDAFPQTRGHALVIHKTAQARNLLDVEPAALAAITATVQRVARMLVAALAPDGLQMIQYNGAAAGQTVFHLHVHLIPRWDGGATGLPDGQRGMADPAVLAALAEEIRAAG